MERVCRCSVDFPLSFHHNIQDLSSHRDNRLKKRNERAPDFKHKDTGAGLWLSSKKAPDWVHQWF